jgi:hypothetical protein
MYLDQLKKAYGLVHEPLDTRLQGKMHALDLLRVALLPGL